MDRNSSKRQQSELTDDDPQSMETDQTIGINMAELLLEVDIDTSQKGKKDGVSDAIKASLALSNRCGGVIRLNDISSTKDMDKWITKYSQQERDEFNKLGECDPHCDGLHLKYSDNDFIFVRKSSNILTEKSNLLVRREKGVHRIRSCSQVKSMLTTLRNNQCQCRRCEKSLQEWECFTKDSILLKLSESKFVEFKNFPDDKFSLNSLEEKVKESVVAFANTDGGTLYIGIEDKDKKVIGQVIADEDKPQIESYIQNFIKETIWIPYSKNSKVTPVKDVNYRIHFFPVEGAVEGDPKRKVIVVEICAFEGTVFLDEPKCPTIDDKNQIVDMALKDWLQYFQNSDQDEKSSKYGRIVYGWTVYKPLKGTMDKILHSPEDPKQVQLHPKHAKEWINNDTLNLLLGVVTGSMTSGGHIFVQKSWNAMLCKPCIKPPTSNICDVLLCSPQSPLVLVTLVEIYNIEVCLYNIALATTLKRVLVQEAGCLEEFLVKPVVITKKQLQSVRAEDIFLKPDCYPTSYVSMSSEKYSKILEALAVVLTRANSSISYDARQKHFMVLTKEQYESLDYCYGSASHVKITGLPGTGKTLLALERIYRLRMEHLQWNEVLYVCSNKTLAAKVKNQKLLDDETPLCKVMNYWQLIESLKFPNQGKISKVKHIVADEVHNYEQQPTGLDFKWWQRLIVLVNNKHLTLWMFLDDSQRITKKPTVTIPDGIVSRRLKTVIRTTGNVFNFCKRYIKSDVQDVVLGHDMQGSKPTILIPRIQTPYSEKEKELVNILLYILYDLIVVKGHSTNSITVLFADETILKRYQTRIDNQAKSCPIRNGEQVLKDGVILETIRRYSGDDNGIVVGFCPEFYHSQRFQDNYALMVSLCSRPRLELILVFDSEHTATSFGVQRHEWKLCPPSKPEKYDFSSRNVFPC